ESPTEPAIGAQQSAHATKRNRTIAPGSSTGDQVDDSQQATPESRTHVRHVSVGFPPTATCCEGSAVSFNNPATPCPDLQPTLSGRGHPVGDGNDAPAWSRKREGYHPPGDLSTQQAVDEPNATRVHYAELHCHTNFSFLDGASDPEVLVEHAARLGLDAL